MDEHVTTTKSYSFFSFPLQETHIYIRTPSNAPTQNSYDFSSNLRRTKTIAQQTTFTSILQKNRTPTYLPTYTLQRCPPSNALITSNYPVLHLHAYDHPDRANIQPSRNKLHLITRALIARPHSAGLYPSPPLPLLSPPLSSPARIRVYSPRRR